MKEINMRGKMKINIFLIAVLFVLLAGNCYANPIVIGPPHIGMFYDNAGVGLVIDLAADCAALCIGYLIIKKIRALIRWRFLPYLIMVFLGGIIIDILTFIPSGFFIVLFHADFICFFMLFLTAGFFLYLFNSWLAEKLFKVELKEKIVIGIVMALLTNPVIGLLFTIIGRGTIE
jgi:hypothetical protein